MSVRVTLVRHGEAAVGWGDDPDPGLSELGRLQVARLPEIVARPAPSSGAILVSSPLRRARETAASLGGAWGVEAEIETAVGEIPSPTDDLDDRYRWLGEVLSSSWPDLDDTVQAWRTRLLEWVAGRDHDVVVATHFVAINAVLGEATGDARVVVEPVANATAAVVEIGSGGLTVVARPGRDPGTAVG